ncbi:MAG: 4Fe-4S binding protein, partial [Endomicrobiia bacterium]
GFNIYIRNTKESPAASDVPLLKKYFSGSFVIKPVPEKYYEIYSDRNLVGYCFYSSEIGVKNSGYGGPINLFVVLDPSFKIIGIDVVEHNETRPYVTDEKLNKFLRQFVEGKEKIESITGATITSNAIISIIEESFLKLDKVHSGKISKENRAKIKFSVVLFIVFMIFVLFGFLKMKNIFRLIGLVFSIFLIGFYTQSTISLVNIANILTGRLISLKDGYFLYLLFGFVFITLILFGRFYCGWICPFGAIQEFINMPLFREKDHILIKSEVRVIKYFFLWLALILVFLFDAPNLANYEPFSTVFTFSGTKLFIIFAVLAILSSVFFSRFYCVYFCPVGAVFGIFSKLSIWKIRVNKNCNACGKCVKICPVGAIEIQLEKARVQHEECIQCNKCIISCPTGGITRTR